MLRRFSATVVTALLLCAGTQAASTPAPNKVEAPKGPIATAAKQADSDISTPTSVKSQKSRLAALFHHKSGRKTQIGKASWYGSQFHGRTTASGEAFDMNLFTAAHKQLPLGTWAKVTNLKNGKWVIVRVNDRGPYVGNRVMDVSSSAADVLGLKASGVGTVKIEVVEPQEMALTLTPTLF